MRSLTEKTILQGEVARVFEGLNVILAAPMLDEPLKLIQAVSRSVPSARISIDGEISDDTVDVIIVDDHARLGKRSFPRLLAVLSLTVGVEHVIAAEALRDTPIYRLLSEEHRQLMREYVAGHLLTSLPLFREPETQQRLKSWEWLSPQAPLAGRRVVLLGLGFLGAPCGALLAAMGMAVTGFSRSGMPLPGIKVVNGQEALNAALTDADFLVCLLPLTAETRGLIGQRELSLLPRHAVVVNASRAGCVGEDALVEALRAGTIAGAIVDVFEREPLASDDPIWSVPNLRVTPHCAATPPLMAHVATISSALDCIISGVMPAKAVDRGKGY